MGWFDASDYFFTETAARDRVVDLTLVKDDKPRMIDRVIDYFGDPSGPCPLSRPTDGD